MEINYAFQPSRIGTSLNSSTRNFNAINMIWLSWEMFVWFVCISEWYKSCGFFCWKTNALSFTKCYSLLFFYWSEFGPYLSTDGVDFSFSLQFLRKVNPDAGLQVAFFWIQLFLDKITRSTEL